MITVPTVQVAAGVIITLFLIVTAKRLTASSNNTLLRSVNDGLTYLTS